MDGTQFVTARGWEDLSNLLDTYETLGLQADEELIREYIQHPKIAEDFSTYLDLYYKYRDDYGVEEILAGQAKPAGRPKKRWLPCRRISRMAPQNCSASRSRTTRLRPSKSVTPGCWARQS